MANNVVGSLLVNLGLSTARLKTDTDKASRHFKKFDKNANSSLGRIKAGVGGLMGKIGMLTGALGILSVGGLGILAKRSLDTADEIQKLNLRLGASTEALSEYRHVMSLSGVDFNAFTKGLQNMVDKISDAAMGTGEAAVALRQLNLNAEQLNRLQPEEQFEAIADALQGITVQGDKTRIAMDLFGGRGVSLLQAMNNGAEGMRAMRDEAKLLGLSLSQDQVDAAALANDEITRLKGAFEGLMLALSTGLAGPLAKLVRNLSLVIPAVVTQTEEAFFNMGRTAAMAWEWLNPSDVSTSSSLAKETAKLTSLTEQYEIASAGAFGTITETLKVEIEQQTNLVAMLKRKNEILRDNQKLAAGGLQIELTKGEGPAQPAEVGPAEDPEIAKQKARLQIKLDNLTLSLMDEESRLFESNARRQDIINTAFDDELITKERQKELLLQLAQDFEKKQTAILIKGGNERLKFDRMNARMKTQTVVGELITMTQGVTGQSRKMFEINKAAALANAIISTHAGVAKSLETYPWPLAGVMAGLHLAAGYAQIQQIKSASFGGGSGAPSLAASGGTPANPVIQDTFEQPQQQQEQGSQITIQIDGNVYANDDFREALVEALEQAQSNDEVRILNVG